jgi:L-serine deaminase
MSNRSKHDYRTFATNSRLRQEPIEVQHAQADDVPPGDSEHAIISAFDLFSIGIGPSSSHTVGPMRAGNIFVTELADLGLLNKVRKIRIAIYGSLALTGEGHMTPSALLLGLEGANVESVDTAYVPVRFNEIKTSKKLRLGAGEAVQEVDFIYDKDFVWEWTKKLPQHSNGLRLTVFDENGDPLATNDLFSIGGGFVVNSGMTTQANHAAKSESQISTSHHPADLAENLYYKAIKKSDASEERRSGAGYDLPDTTSTDQSELVTRKAYNLNVGSFDGSTSGSYPAPLLFRNANHLLALCKQHNLTIAQLMFENEKALGMTETEIFDKLFRIWEVMDDCIREGVSASAPILPGSLKLRRRAPGLYRKLTRGLYPEHTQPPQQLNSSDIHALPIGNSSTAIEPSVGSTTPAVRRRGMGFGRRAPPVVHGSPMHPISVSPNRSASHRTMDYLTVYAIAVNETNAAGGRVVTAPTNGAAGIIPAVLKYIVEFVSDDPERDVPIFLLTAAAIASLFKRGATISAAEGGCMAEVGVACSMAAGAYTACMGGGPEAIEQAAEIGIEHNLGLTCDPIGGLVQAPCIERNALGAIKAVSSANLALNGDNFKGKVSLDDAIRAMRVTAKGMKDEFKETSLSGLATSVPLNIPVSVPDC